MTVRPAFPGSGDFDEDSWAYFVQLVDAEVGRHGVPFSWVEEGAAITLQGEAGARGELSVLNLARVVRLHPDRAEWPALVRRHLEVCLRAGVEGFAAVRDGLEKAIDQLKVRLYPEDWFVSGAPLVHRQVLPGVRMVLVRDLEDSVVSVPWEQAALWGLSQDVLLSLAIESTLAHPPESVQRIVLDEELSLTAWQSADNFVTSHVLGLSRSIAGEAGAFVALPHRHLVLLHPILGERSLRVLPTMAQIAEMAFADGPGSLTPRVFWWCDGRFEPLGIRVVDRQLVVEAPDALGQQIARLSRR